MRKFKKWVLGLWWWHSNAYCNCKEEWPIRYCEGPSRKRSGQFHPNQCRRFQCSTLGSHEQFEIVSYGGDGVIIIIYTMHYLFKNLINSSKSFRVEEYFTSMSVTVYPADMQCIFLFSVMIKNQLSHKICNLVTIWNLENSLNNIKTFNLLFDLILKTTQ